MKSNYDRSKTIIRKTTKNYHPRADADDRKKRVKAIDQLCIEKMPYPTDWPIILVFCP